MSCGRRKFCGLGDATDRWFDLGRKTLVREISVQKIVRSIRAFDNYLQQKVTGNELKKLMTDSKKMTLK